jgi:mRNA interferase HigB
MKRVRLIKAGTVTRYASTHAGGAIQFAAWLWAIRSAKWSEPSDIIKSYGGNLLGGGSERVIFDLGSNGRNAFRMICKYRFGTKNIILYVCWIGTHEEYNKLTPCQKRTVFAY